MKQFPSLSVSRERFFNIHSGLNCYILPLNDFRRRLVSHKNCIVPCSSHYKIRMFPLLVYMCLLLQSQVSGIPTSVWISSLFFWNNLSLLYKSVFLRLPGRNSKFTVWHWSWLILMLTLASYRSPLSICFLECKPGYQQPDGKVMKTKSCKCPNTGTNIYYSRPSKNDCFFSLNSLVLLPTHPSSTPTSLLVTMATFPDWPIYFLAPAVIKVSWHSVVLLPSYCLFILSDTEGPREKLDQPWTHWLGSTWIREIIKKRKNDWDDKIKYVHDIKTIDLVQTFNVHGIWFNSHSRHMEVLFFFIYLVITVQRVIHVLVSDLWAMVM